KDTTTLKARISPFSNESKVYISGTSTPRWETGDLVNVNGTRCTVSVSTTSTIEAPTSNTYQAVYPNDLVANNGNQLGSSTVTLNIPRVQAYETTTNGQVVKAPMGAFVSGSSNLQFTNMGALLAIAVKNDKSDRDNLVIDSIAVQTVGNSPVLLWGTATVSDITSAQRAYEISSTGLSETEIPDHRIISLAKLSEQGNLATLATDETKTFYLYVPSVTGSIDNRYKITIYSHIGGTKYIYERTQSNAGSGNIGLSQYAAVPYMTNDATETRMADTWLPGSIHSIFTIYNSSNPSEKRYIYFSQGNLQYTNNQYQFASNQEDYFTDNLSASHTDLFAVQQQANYDIGPTIEISNGGGQHNNNWRWRTLTKNEWGSLLGLDGFLNRRLINGQGGEDHCFNIVNLNGTLGILIYPDEYSGTTYPASSGSGLAKYPAIDDIPEGCVFLPASGYASANFSHSNGGTFGYYWSSSSSTTFCDALRFGINTATAIPQIRLSMGYKYAIRLVRDTNITQ
ncbi:MAG: hypothetical protein J6T03_02020, partial [Bacteroidales bacterium]|nr:hypothetical protein [Bacteroidales bacterium]